MNPDDPAYTQSLRELRSQLFGESTEEKPDPMQGNHVAHEGNNPGEAKPADYEERRFARELFGYDPEIDGRVIYV